MAEPLSKLEALQEPGPRADRVVAYYDSNAEELANRYESLTFEAVHEQVIGYLPDLPAEILDVGAGSGRDAAALVRRGYSVTAVEPSRRLLEIAKRLHGDLAITWVNDCLPELAKVRSIFDRFDVILVSAVWMHLSGGEQSAAMVNLAKLLTPKGRLCITFREGPSGGRPGFHSVSVDGIVSEGASAGLSLLSTSSSPDVLGREDLVWKSVILERNDEPTS